MSKKMPIYYTNSNSCYPNNAIVIGGVNTAAKRRIQRKSLHSCRQMEVKLSQVPSRDELYSPIQAPTKLPPPTQAPSPPPKPSPPPTKLPRPTPAPTKLPRPTPPPHNCLTREVWSDEKTKWCCENYRLGCPK